MQLEQSPPKDNLQHILNALKIKNIDELLSNEQHSIEGLAKTTNNHKLIVEEYMSIIQQHITKPYTALPSVTITLDSIFTNWGSNEKKQQVKWSINSTSIVEIIGRANGGKTFLLNEIIVECIKNKQKIIYLDSNHNFEKLSLRIGQELNQNTGLKEQNIWFKHFQFKNLCELSILLHCIGNELYNTKEPYFVFIDSLSRSEQPQNENNQAASSMQFKFVDKFKRLLVQLNQHLGGIVYATKCSNSNVLFNQTYKIQRQRPKWVGSTTKQWDSIADKTLCVDYTRTGDEQEYWRVISTKSINNKLVTLSRKCQ